MTRPESASARAARVLVVAVVVAAVGVGLATVPVAADEHTFDEAEDFTDAANFTINLPERTDHYPGDHSVHSGSNGYNASIEYFAAGEEAFRELDAEEGSYLDMIIIQASWIDYSECDATSNTKAFGIDRGNNDSGTRTDEGLIQYRKNSELKPGGLTVTFYDFEDLSGDPPYLAPEDAIVAAQGVGSNDGPCLKMTSDPGWYRMTGFINGTAADNGKGERPSDDARRAGIIAKSNYVYICECDSEAEARETLGPPPNEGGGTPAGTPTPTVTPDPTNPDPTARPTTTANLTATGTPTATPTPARRTTATGGGATTTPTSQVPDRKVARADGQDGSRTTPTVAEGPGFTTVAVLLALLAGTGLLARRR